MMNVCQTYQSWEHGFRYKCLHYLVREAYCGFVLRTKNSFYQLIFFFVALRPNVGRGLLFLRFLDHTQRRTTVRRTPLDELSARRRDLYLATHNNYNRQISMPPCGIRTHDLSRRAAAVLRLRMRGHWDRHELNLPFQKEYEILRACS
jgi:hypothetical protein